MDKLPEPDKRTRKYFGEEKPDLLMVWDKINEIVEFLNEQTEGEGGK